MTSDTLKFLLQQLGFVTNLKKSVLPPAQSMEFFRIEEDSVHVTRTFSEIKKRTISI